MALSLSEIGKQKEQWKVCEGIWGEVNNWQSYNCSVELELELPGLGTWQQQQQQKKQIQISPGIQPTSKPSSHQQQQSSTWQEHFAVVVQKGWKKEGKNGQSKIPKKGSSILLLTTERDCPQSEWEWGRLARNWPKGHRGETIKICPMPSLFLFFLLCLCLCMCVCLLATTTNTTNTVYLSRVEAKDEKETRKQKRRNQSVIHATAAAEARSHSLILFLFLLLHHFLPTKGSKAENWCKHTQPHNFSFASLWLLIFIFSSFLLHLCHQLTWK